jgi:hypothetical protein
MMIERSRLAEACNRISEVEDVLGVVGPSSREESDPWTLTISA